MDWRPALSWWCQSSQIVREINGRQGIDFRRCVYVDAGSSEHNMRYYSSLNAIIREIRQQVVET